MIRLIGFTMVHFLLLFLSGKAAGQNAFQYPATFSQFYNQYSMLNPAATGAESKLAVRTGNQFNSGIYSRIRCFFALTEFQLRNKENSLHALSISFMNNSEGKLLDFNRAYLQYAFHLSLSGKWKLAGGASLGFLNFSAEQTATSPAVSSYAPDGGLGIWLYTVKQQIGFSSSQVFARPLTVILERIPIQRYYRFIYSGRFSLSANALFIPSFQFSFNRTLINADVNASILLKNLVMIGAGYRFERGSAYFFGLKDFSFSGSFFDISFSYNSGWPGPNMSGNQTVELILAYKLQNKK